MKVYAVCEACDDTYYGYLKPLKVFGTREKASALVRELDEDGYDYNVFEYEVE